jgi:hypothetical protein
MGAATAMDRLGWRGGGRDVKLGGGPGGRRPDRPESADRCVQEESGMAWFSRFTRFGDMHWVFGQENTIACGVACVIMAAYKINKFTPGVKSSFTETDVIALATRLFGPNPLGSAGLDNPQILQLLNHPDLGMTGWSLGRLPATDVPAKLISEIGTTGGIGPKMSVKPMIVGIDWTGGGGHWVLVDTVRTWMGKKYATVCDPWDANVHVVRLKEAKTFAYTADKVTGVDFWGTHHSYDAVSAGGCFLGDLLWRT